MNRLRLLLLWPVLALGLAFTLIRYGWAIFTAPDKAWRIADAVDRTGNVAVNGYYTSRISDRAARARNAGRKWGCVLCRLLDVVDKGHCDRMLEG